MIHKIEPSIVNIKEMMISKIKVTSTDMKQLVKLASIDASSMGADVPERRTLVSRDRHSQVTEDILAERFGISPKTARATLAATLQNRTRSAILPLSRRYKVDSHYNLKRLDGKFSTDTLYSTVRSLIGNTCSQLYTHKFGFSAPYHMPRTNDEHDEGSLSNFIHEYEIPAKLTFDGAIVQTGRNITFMSNVRKHKIDYHVSQSYTPNENQSEDGIR